MRSFALALPVLATAQELTAPKLPGQQFGMGFITGFFGDEPAFTTCLEDVSTIPEDVAALVKYLNARDISGAVGEISDILEAVVTSLRDCKVTGDIVKDILTALKDIRSVKDFLQHIKDDITKYDEMMLEELEQASKVCTFNDPDPHECGRLIGAGSRQLIIGDDPSSVLHATRGKMDFVQGLLSALIGDTEDVDACASDAGGFADIVKKTMQDITAKDLTAAIDDLVEILGFVSTVVRDCKKAMLDLGPYLHILDGVSTKGDLYKKIKANALKCDEDVLDQTGDMFKSCTFAKPDGHKCGHDMGTIVRDFATGECPVDVIV